MPKATRKKKLKEQDFKKAKLKVGKKKPAANNDTNVSFKSQAIVVPNQSINDDKPHEEVLSSKNQSLKDLLAQLRHYSAQARKEALVGLRELQHRHPIPLRSHLSALFTSLAPLLVDDEPQVRKLLLSFFDDLAQRVTAEHVRPFMGLTMAYTCSAMTHIGEEVRLDGLRALDVWIRRWPGIVGGFAEKVIPNYLSMLISNGKNKGGMTSTGASLLVNPRSQLGSAKTRVEVLESLLGFLTLILRKDDDPWWFFPSSAPKKAASSIRGQLRTYRWSDYKQTGIVIHDSVEYLDIHTNATASATTPGLFGAGSGPAIKSDRVSIGVSTSTSKVDTSIRNVYHLDELEHLKALTDVLMPTLVDLWLESSPSVFTAGTITLTPALGVMHSVLKMMNLIWRTFLLQFKDRVDGGWVEGWFKGIQKHLMVHFPFGKGNFAHRDKQVDNVLQDMNILFCELLSHFLLQNPTKNRAEEEAGHSWQGLMLDYMLDVFNGKKSKGETATVTQLTPQQLQASLPVVWSLLSTLGEPGYSEFLQAFIAMTNAAGGTPCAPLGFEFLFRLVKLPPSASPSQSDAAVTTHLQTFLLTLPKRLWQLKQSNPTLTLSILSMLLHTLRNNPRGLARTPAFVTGLQSALTPFFWVETPKGGVFGPFVEAAEETQVLALSVGYYLGAWGEKLARGVAECLTHISTPTSTTLFALQLLHHRHTQSPDPLPHATFASLVFTIGVVGYTSSNFHALRTSAATTTRALGMVIGTEALLGRDMSPTVFWERRKAVVGEMRNVVGQDLGLAEGFLGGVYELVNQSLVLPIDTCYGIAAAMDVLASHPRATEGVFEEYVGCLANVFVPAAVAVFSLPAGNEARKASTPLLDTLASLFTHSPPLRRQVLANIAERFRSDHAPPVTEMLALLKIATRLMLGYERLRGVIQSEDGAESVAVMEGIHSGVVTYLNQTPTTAALGLHHVRDEVDMLGRFLA